MPSAPHNLDELAYWVALHGAPKIGPATFHRLIRKFGSPQDVMRASAGDLLVIPGADAALLDSITFAGIRIDYTRKLVERLLERNIRIITFRDAAYPQALNKLKWPPGLIYVQGDYTDADQQSVGIVGSTHASARAFRTAYRSAGALAGRGYTIVSGNARGVDSAAHLGAIDAGGRTVFVLPDGILSFRPNAEITPGKIQRHAVVISECPPEAAWEREAAIARNRITAALSTRLFIVEAEAENGTLCTFRNAKELGIPAMAAAFGPDTPKGNLAAIREGAAEVKSIAELLHAVATGKVEHPQTQQSFGWE